MGTARVARLRFRPLEVILLAVAGAAGLFPASVYGRCDDPAAAEAARARIAETCRCDAATRHGQYVSCVAREVRTAVTNGLPTNCKGAVVRCAARSTCGKKTGFVTCAQCSPGTCDTTTNLCDDGVTPCPVAPATCPPVLDHCSTKSDAALCISREGETAVVGSGSCCDAGCTLD